MKKWKSLLAILVVVGSLFANCSVAEAVSDKVTVVQVGRSVEVLADDEMVDISMGVIGGTVSQPMESNASYTAYRYTDAFEFYLDGMWIARVDVEAIVWHYTDGKVHLYSRSIGVTRLSDNDAARVYGSIVNTDGSYSYTTGDRVHLYLDQGTWSFAIDFYVSNTEAYFSCYEV